MSAATAATGSARQRDDGTDATAAMETEDGGGPGACSAFDLLQDLERRRHKKNPFDAKFLQFCLSKMAATAASGGLKQVMHARFGARTPRRGH